MRGYSYSPPLPQLFAPKVGLLSYLWFSLSTAPSRWPDEKISVSIFFTSSDWFLSCSKASTRLSLSFPCKRVCGSANLSTSLWALWTDVSRLAFLFFRSVISRDGMKKRMFISLSYRQCCKLWNWSACL